MHCLTRQGLALLQCNNGGKLFRSIPAGELLRHDRGTITLAEETSSFLQNAYDQRDGSLLAHLSSGRESALGLRLPYLRKAEHRVRGCSLV